MKNLFTSIGLLLGSIFIWTLLSAIAKSGHASMSVELPLAISAILSLGVSLAIQIYELPKYRIARKYKRRAKLAERKEN